MRSILISFFLLCLLPGITRGENAPAPAAAPLEQAKWDNLASLIDTIRQARERLQARRVALRSVQDESERAQIDLEVEQTASDLKSLQMALEMMVTGGVDLGLFGTQTKDAKFDWREQLQSVFEPVLVELKKLTERPRKIERLRGDQNYYKERLTAAEAALTSIAAYRKQAPSVELRQVFGGYEDRWRQRRDNLKNRLKVIDFELQEMFAPVKATARDPIEALKDLLSGRILNLAIAVAVMALVYLLMFLFDRLIARVLRRRIRVGRGFLSRLGTLAYTVMTGILLILSGIVTLYLLGDWLLLGVFIILLVGAALVIQRSLPHYLAEAKLILNLGSVREGERIIYEDLPWRVKLLGFYTTLINPSLQGGILRIPSRELVSFHSRAYTSDEPWFPTDVGDFVLLGDGSYGQVLSQSPEIVQIKSLGAIKTYRSTKFVDQDPRNLSRTGFTVVATFGLDYQHQADITESIRSLMETEVRAGLAGQGLSEYLAAFSVEFGSAAASSLDLAIIANFNGKAAGRYFGIQRCIQRLAVEACNRHGWVIPFNQITVHSA